MIMAAGVRARRLSGRLLLDPVMVDAWFDVVQKGEAQRLQMLDLRRAVQLFNLCR